MILTEKDKTLIACARCEKEVLPTQLYAFDGEEGGYCLDCFLSTGMGTSILSHTYQPIPIFCHMSMEREDKETTIYKTNGKMVKKMHRLLYLGIELEIENRSRELTQYSYDLQNKYALYIKHDGSLQSGLELVSYPQTAKYHQKAFNWYGLLEELRKDKSTSYDNERCGLHIHVNKNFFTGKDDILKVVLFFYKCFNKIKIFAKRHNVDYCKKWEQSLINYVKESKGGKMRVESNEDRYTCINLQNANTAEFRVYRGTLNYERFLASILFTDAVCNFAKNYSIVFFVNEKHKSNILWGKFIDFIGENDRYDFLKKYFKNHNLDNKQISKIVLPNYEDYSGSKVKVTFKTITNLKTLCRGNSWNTYLLNGLEYEYVESELPSIDFHDSNNYIIHQGDSERNIDTWVIPKRIARLKLNKDKLTYKQMAGTIRLYLQYSEYTLRIMKNDITYQECSTLLAFFRVMGSGYGLYGDTGNFDIERQIEDFMRSTKFKYEIVRSDLLSVYNYS